MEKSLTTLIVVIAALGVGLMLVAFVLGWVNVVRRPAVSASLVGADRVAGSLVVSFRVSSSSEGVLIEKLILDGETILNWTGMTYSVAPGYSVTIGNCSLLSACYVDASGRSVVVSGVVPVGDHVLDVVTSVGASTLTFHA